MGFGVDKRSVFDRVVVVGGRGRGGQQCGGTMKNDQDKKKVACHYWIAGRCARRPCPYLHSSLAQRPIPTPPSNENKIVNINKFSNTSANTSSSHQQEQGQGQGQGQGRPSKYVWIRGNESSAPAVAAPPPKTIVCRNWMDTGNCASGDKCRYLHSCFTSDSFTMLAHLPGHHNAITGISLPTGSGTLFSSSKDHTLKAWDCVSGASAGVEHLGAEIASLHSHVPWLFAGTPNTVWAFNSQTNAKLALTAGPVGQVYALAVAQIVGMLFAGAQDGSILAWRMNETSFDLAPSLKGHDLGVVTLIVGADNLYSGSIDTTIRVWDLHTLQCTQTLTEHTSVVMSVLCWDLYMLSSSLDGTIKVWAYDENLTLEVIYTHTHDHGVLRLCGTHDSQSKPVLLCSCNNNVVYLYDLPSFKERGKIFSKEEVRGMGSAPDGLFFTGDATGDLSVEVVLKRSSSLFLFFPSMFSLLLPNLLAAFEENMDENAM